MLSKIQSRKGFTLIELMIVVAIIGILAAIAIPNFLKFQLKSRTSEGRTNLGTIRTINEAFRAEWDWYAITAAYPAGVAPSAARNAWPIPPAPAGAFDLIGFQPAGNVYFIYAIVGAPPLAPSGLGAQANNIYTNAGADTTIDPATGDLTVGTAVAPTAGAANVTYVASSDLDNNTIIGSFFTDDENVDIRPDPVDYAANVF